MHPLLFRIAELRFHSYPTLLAVAFLVATLLAEREGSLLKRPVYVPPQGAVWVLLGALFGAKVFFLIQYSEPKYLWHAFLLWEAGYVYYGGLIGGFTAGVIYCYRIDNLDFRVADACVPFLALGQGIARFGCFLNGCCWGVVCDLPWAVQFPKGGYAHDLHVAENLIDVSAETSLAVHPTQIYTMAGLVAICLILRHNLKRSPFTFAIFLQYMFFYGLLRFTMEIFRGDSARSIYGLTVSQTISLAMVVIALIVYPIGLKLARRKGSSPPEPPAPAVPEEEPTPAESA